MKTDKKAAPIGPSTPPSDATERTGNKQYNWPLWLILLLTAAIYGQSLNHDFTHLDDDYYVLNNPYLRDSSLQGLKAIFTSFYSGNYHPLTTIVLQFLYRCFGLWAAPYHATNVALHLANTVLVYLFVEKLSKNKLSGWIVAFPFAVHPMHVESVAWISEIKDVMYAFFYLLALLQYITYQDTGYRAKHYWLVFILFFASLLSKSAAVTLPVLLLAIDWYRGRKIDKRAILEKLPMIAVSILFGILAILSQRAGGALNKLLLSYGNINSVFLFTSSLAFYIRHLVVPYPLSAMHYYPATVNGWLPWPYYLSLPFMGVLAWLVFRKRPANREVLFGIVFFGIAISVMLQIISIGSALTSERYTYISYIGLFYIIGHWLPRLIKHQKTAMVALGLWGAALCCSSWQRIGVWQGDETLFQDMCEKNPDFYYVYWLRANHLTRTGRADLAIADYNKSVALYPNFEDAYFNRGNVYADMGDAPNAITDYNKTIALNPKMADAYNNRGWAYFKIGNLEQAFKDYAAAIGLNPRFADAYNNRGWAYLQTKNYPAALADLDAAIRIKPDFSRAIHNRASLKAITHDPQGAIADYNLLETLMPNDHEVYYLRAFNKLELHDLKGACNDWAKAKGLGNEKAGNMLEMYCR